MKLSEQLESDLKKYAKDQNKDDSKRFDVRITSDYWTNIVRLIGGLESENETLEARVEELEGALEYACYTVCQELVNATNKEKVCKVGNNPVCEIAQALAGKGKP